jgi:CDP-4-dehydro-6-deoxyglucose reductase, E1
MLTKDCNREEILKEVKNFLVKNKQIERFIPGQTYIPASGKLIDEQEVLNMIDAAMDGWLTTGRFNALFEKKLATFLDVKHLITVNSGSSANLVAFNTLTSPKLGDKRITKGDEFITVAAGFPTTVNPAIQYGAVPVFVDVNPKTHNIDETLIEAAISDKTKAIILAHTLGNPFNLEIIRSICDKYNLWLIEDTCDALGAEYNGKKVGAFGDIGTLSFYPAHHITMGEGGAVFTNNDQLKVIAESFRDWGRDCYCPPGKDNTCGCRFSQQCGNLPFGYDHKYVYSHLGYNLKITDMQAACGLAQLEKLESFILKRRENFNLLKERLSSLNEYLSFAEPTKNSTPSWFGFPITIRPETGVSRVDLTQYLEQAKIGTRLLFAGNLIKQPYFNEIKYKVVGSLNNTELTMTNTFWIGVQPTINPEKIEYIAEKLEEFFGLNF